MNYTAQSRTPNPGALIGALAIPAGVGALLVIGLVVTGPLPKLDGPLIGFNVTPVETPPPPPKPPEQATERTDDTVTQTSQKTDFTLPKPDIDLNSGPVVLADTFDKLDDTLILAPGPVGPPKAEPPVAPAGPAKAASPRGNPGNWITESDYRTRWISEGLSGTASFTLEIDASGRVSDCRITGSTGHDVLDGATCRLLERRARFNPARTGDGAKVTGSYSGTISWEIP
jgi:protein TonB